MEVFCIVWRDEDMLKLVLGRPKLLWSTQKQVSRNIKLGPFLFSDSLRVLKQSDHRIPFKSNFNLPLAHTKEEILW